MHWRENSMTAEKLNKTLLSLLPEIKSSYIQETEWQEGDSTGSHIVFGDVLTPFIIDCFTKQNDIMLKKCFDVIEKILSFNNDYANEVITLSVLESLFYGLPNDCDPQLYMGKKTKSIFKQIMRQTDQYGEQKHEK